MKIEDVWKERYGKRRYVPVVAILAAVTTLLLVLALYTARNLTLARQRLENSLLQQGVVLSRAIEAGSRAGMRMSWRIAQLQTLVEEISHISNVVYISVIDRKGVILAHTRTESIGQTADLDLTLFHEHPTAIFPRKLTLPDEREIFEISTGIVQRTGVSSEQSSVQGWMGQGRQGRMGHHNMEHGSRGMMGEQHGLTDIAVIQIGMDTTEFKDIQGRDIRNAVLMLLVLSVAGSAALYFIVLTQNYYAVNHAFQTMQSYTQHVVDSMANGLISLDPHGNLVTMNRQAHRILAIPQDEHVEGKALADVIILHDLDLFQLLADEYTVLEREVRGTNPVNQTSLPLSLSASILADNEGNQLGSVLLFRDLRDVKALQEQVKRAERLASLGQLAAGVAHEIRNPLGALKGFLQYFHRKPELQEQDKTYLTVMIQEVDRLNTVISHLLDFARPKTPDRQPCDMVELIQHVLTLIEGDLEAQQIGVTFEPDASLPHIPVDRDQLTQVLLNILLNSIQATEKEGRILIDIRVFESSQQCELRITDTGKGIAAADVAKVFDPFFSTKKHGTGLGLAVAYTIIDNHGGQILVESQEGRGTTFRIFLPM